VTLRVFIGYDHRQPVAFNVCASSIMRRASKPVAIIPLTLKSLAPFDRGYPKEGLTEFTYSRFLVPSLSGFEGVSVFLDADMIVLDDIYNLVEDSPVSSVSVVQCEKRFEWPSMMVFRNLMCSLLTTEYVQTAPPDHLFRLEWAHSVGMIDPKWNFCVGYDKPPQETPKLIHYTQGIPCFPETKNCDYAKLWHKELSWMNSTVTWEELMGKSVHAVPVKERIKEVV